MWQIIFGQLNAEEEKFIKEEIFNISLQVSDMMDQEGIIVADLLEGEPEAEVEDEIEECEFCGGKNGEHGDISTMERVYPGEPHMADVGSRPCPNSRPARDDDDYDDGL